MAQLGPENQDRTGSMQLLHGTVKLDGGQAEVAVPDGFYLLGPADTRNVIEKLWGNPADTTLLGLMFPANMTPFGAHDWAATFQFDSIGYVSDSDAEDYNYDDLLKSMQDDTDAENPDRVKGGFPSVTLVGWAEPPHYDKADRKLVWAKRLTFSGTPGETLNYNIRALGRKGVLVVNFIADMEELADVQAAAPKVMKAISFTDGNRYADYVPSLDTVAAVGIGGLIAGKVLSSTGILVVALLLLKKGAVLILLPLIWVRNKIKGRNKGGGTGAGPIT
ncbi:MAG: DUF2167 domain-containing protein, partial [Paracoccaceae bacterium]